VINQDALKSVQERIEAARARANRENDPPVQIVAITKTFPASAIESAHRAGIENIGENRIQEASQKFPHLTDLPRLTKRLVGHLQSNKAGKAIDLFDAIDSIDSVKLARRLSMLMAETDSNYESLLQVNTGQDSAKHGFHPENLETLLEALELKNLGVKGLMTIGVFTSDETTTRKTFQKLRQIKERLNRHLPEEDQLTELSMGMSSDYEIAVEEGATMLRIGTALFGEREQ
jgi:hypothetical protein|tara:strand:- start:7083 stop:7778 length:696 start_codon:yes stop_codon:yes gene_type:complete